MKPAEILIPLGLAACADVHTEIGQGSFYTEDSSEDTGQDIFECELPDVTRLEGLIDTIYGEEPYGIHASACPEGAEDCESSVVANADLFSAKLGEIRNSDWITVVGVLPEHSYVERALAVMPGQHCFEIADDGQADLLYPFFYEESLISSVWGNLESNDSNGVPIEWVSNAIMPARFDRDAGDEFVAENQIVDGAFYNLDSVQINGVDYFDSDYDLSNTRERIACLGRTVLWGVNSPLHNDDATWDLRGDSWCREMQP